VEAGCLPRQLDLAGTQNDFSRSRKENWVGHDD
jgi:hypothetical protein